MPCRTAGRRSRQAASRHRSTAPAAAIPFACEPTPATRPLRHKSCSTATSWRRAYDNVRAAPAAQRVAPAQLGKALASARPGDRLVIEPGTYADAAINLTNGGGAAGRPVIIDGNNAVTFTGSSQIQLGASHVVLRGFMFRDVGVGAITIAAPSVRITESIFENCGDPTKPQAECVIARLGGENAELDFNTFVGSRSMTIKIRAGGDNDRSQPTGAFIHHNVFRDITRLSNNGQEPIQIAGPNGGGTNAELRARIEHNLFYRAEGDREAVSIKTPGTTLRWNVFRDMDAAPNIRGSRNATVSDNLLIRTRPIRINGSDHRVEGNVVLCPAAGVGFVVSHGSPGYETAVNTLIRDNVDCHQARRYPVWRADAATRNNGAWQQARLKHVLSAEEPSDL